MTWNDVARAVYSHQPTTESAELVAKANTMHRVLTMLHPYRFAMLDCYAWRGLLDRMAQTAVHNALGRHPPGDGAWAFVHRHDRDYVVLVSWKSRQIEFRAVDATLLQPPSVCPGAVQLDTEFDPVANEWFPIRCEERIDEAIAGRIVTLIQGMFIPTS